MFYRKMKPKSGAGFTLIELLVVIAIIGILSAVVLTNMPAARNKGRVAKAQTQIKDIALAISLLEVDTGEWPGHQPRSRTNCGAIGNEFCGTCAGRSLNDGLAGLVLDDSFPSWNGPYYKGPSAEIPNDPWGNEYFFDTDYWVDGTCRVVVGSYGPDGAGGHLCDAVPCGQSTDDVIYIISASTP